MTTQIPDVLDEIFSGPPTDADNLPASPYVAKSTQHNISAATPRPVGINDLNALLEGEEDDDVLTPLVPHVHVVERATPHDEYSVTSRTPSNSQFDTMPVPKDALLVEDIAGGNETPENDSAADASPEPCTEEASKQDSEIQPDALLPPLGNHNQYAKPIRYTSTFKAFYPHFVMAGALGLCALFPSIVSGLFKPTDLAQLPDWLVSKLPLIIQLLCGGLAIMLMLLVFKQKASGTLKVYGDYLEFRKGLAKASTIHYADLRTVEVHRCLASMYAPIGDLHIISPREHIVLTNVDNPFLLQQALLERRKALI